MISLSDLNWNILEIFFLIIIFVIGFLTTYFILPPIIKFMEKKKFVGIDIHKNTQPEVAESGGLSIIIGFTISSIFLMVFFPTFLREIIIFLLTVILAGFIGFIDDRKKLRSRYKIILSIFSGGIIFLANFFGFIAISSPTIPFLDKTRLTIIYPFLVPVIIAVFVNTVNMLEGYNGEGSGTCLIAVCFLFICGLIWGSAEAVIFTVPVIAVLIPFFLFNKYPAKVFPGDVGTLSMGAMIACIMLFGSLEVATFCALLIHIFNSFYYIYSVRGFFESSDIKENKKEDIILLEDDRIKASDQKEAILTLPRLILARGPLTESDLIKNFYAISIICGFFSILSIILIQYTLDLVNLYILFIMLIIFFIPTVLILYKFPRIRGIIVLMIILLIFILFFLLFIESVIMTLPLGDIDLKIIRIPINLLLSLILIIPILLLWYILTIKYFWMEINKIKKLETEKTTY
jgi:UDP-N-acetylglucosamine--dolichyl-phosphate N-acetylglucosaminephosphotransferase